MTNFGTRLVRITGVLGLLLSTLEAGCSPQAESRTSVVPREVHTQVDRLSSVRFNSDGSRLAVGGANGEVLIWRDINDPPQPLEVKAASPVVSMTWSPDGMLAVTNLDKSFCGWQFGKAEPVRVEFPGLPTPAVCVAFRSTGPTPEIVIGMKDGSLVFLDKQGAKQIKPQHRGSVKQLLFSPDGRWLVSAGADGQLVWWDVATRSSSALVKAHESEVTRLLISRDGQQIVSADWNGVIKTWDMTSRKMLRQFQHDDAVSGLDWCKSKLVSGGWNGTLKIWNATSGTCLRTIAGNPSIQDLSADPKSNRIATVHLDRSLRFWELAD